MQFQSLCPIFPARDLAETEAFYQAIGFRTEGLYPEYGYLIMRKDGAEVHFWHHPTLEPEASNHAGYLRLPEVDSLSDHLTAAGIAGSEGIPRFGAAEDTPWGMREVTWVDPNGTLIRAGAFMEETG